MMKKILLTVLLCLLPTLLLADVSNDLDRYYKSLGYADNVTAPHAYEGQEAGYYTGGSLYLRGQSRTISPVHLDIPSLKAGCGGIDMFMGAASFINSKQLVKFANDIMSNAGPYFFQLALETYLPQGNDVMTKLQYWEQQINNMSMNSCEVAQDTIGGLWPQHTGAQQQICRDLATHQTQFGDWAAARQGCGADGKGNQILADQPADVKQSQGISINVNIVWSAILSRNFLEDDNALAEFLMSLSGTVIFDADGNPTVYPSLAQKSDLVNALLYGGPAQTYVCDETTNCLKPTITTITISQDSGLTMQVAKMLTQIQQDLVQDTQPLSKEEKGFLNMTSIPVLKFIQISAESGSSININDYATLIAQDLISQYLSDCITSVEVALSSSNYGDAKKQMEDSLGQAEQYTRDLKNSVEFKVMAATALVQNAMAAEKQVTGQLSGQLQANLGS